MLMQWDSDNILFCSTFQVLYDNYCVFFTLDIRSRGKPELRIWVLEIGFCSQVWALLDADKELVNTTQSACY